MTLWEERAARNEALFREVNEAVENLAAQAPDEAAGFVCECSDEGCIERLEVPLDIYESARADPRRFLLVPGHETDVEHVVGRGDGYVIVEKDGLAGKISDRTDPRE